MLPIVEEHTGRAGVFGKVSNTSYWFQVQALGAGLEEVVLYLAMY